MSIRRFIEPAEARAIFKQDDATWSYQRPGGGADFVEAWNLATRGDAEPSTARDAKHLVNGFLAATSRGLGDRLRPPNEVDVSLQIIKPNTFQVLVQTPDMKVAVGRHFTRDKVGNVSVKETRTDFREGGFGKPFYREQIPFYRAHGINEVTLEATEIGKYAWARFGFIPASVEEWDEVRGILRGRLATIERMASVRSMRPGGLLKLVCGLTGAFDAEVEAIKDDIRGLLDSADPRAFRELSKMADASPLDNAIVKALLLANKTWEGRLDLANAEDLKHVSDYAGIPADE